MHPYSLFSFFFTVSMHPYSLFSFIFTEILSNLGSPHPAQEDSEKQPQADVKEGENHFAV